ncbi:MAG: bifunctional aconitate hydratase 2/2-methylisocitrate dehydratase [Planctomycetes bacterium]|nr:bifunctional aconitate hydratase 2/2-methylisocitrate dehydratase [Planctomycetota bacterium]
MLEAYRAAAAERAKLGIPPLPLNPEQTAAVCRLLESPDSPGEELRHLLCERVPPGVDPAAKIKAEWLGAVAHGEVASPWISRADAIRALGQMLGGYNVPYLVRELEGPLAELAADQLARLVLVFDNFAVVAKLASEGNAVARQVIARWAAAEWFTSRPALPAEIHGVVYKIPGETNTDDLSPAQSAVTRPDIPLHALDMYKTRDPQAVPALLALRARGERPIIVGDVYGTGSSRKSATNSVMWYAGVDIPGVPNKRTGAVLIAGIIAPIFLDTFRDAGGIAWTADVSSLSTGDRIVIRTATGEILKDGTVVARGSWRAPTMGDEFRAGGRTNLIIGRALTWKACDWLGVPYPPHFAKPTLPADEGRAYTLAQKIVGRACGVRGVAPGVSCEPKVTTVGSQDTTGPMTAEELKELACLSFAAPFVLQSFCHTAAYPTAKDAKMHRWLPQFIVERNGVSLRPGDGIIHSWLNRMCLPDTVGTGADSHTRFPIGISFPGGSGLVAFAAAIGYLPLDMPESVLVRFTGRLQPGVTLRDLVNAIPWIALLSGDLTLEKKGKKNVYNGRILEIEGLEHLTAEQAFELSDASAERSAAACVVNLSERSVAEYLRSNVALIEAMIADGYGSRATLERRRDEMLAWLANPQLLRADPGLELVGVREVVDGRGRVVGTVADAADRRYARVFTIDMTAIDEPLLACPNDPDKIRTLSEEQGARIDEVFVGSCMTNIGHFRALANVYRQTKTEYLATVTWICPPTRMDEAVLMQEGHYALFGQVGARREIPGCSLCMGNQARVRPGATVFSTSTRNFDNRMGRDAKVYLGSAELAAVVSILGRIPTPQEYRSYMAQGVDPFARDIYKYLDFTQLSARLPDYRAAAANA